MSGLFITLEGPEGSGKTTAALRIVDTLKTLGYEVVYTREPGGIEIAEQIRQVILDPKNMAMDAKTEALLYAASRRQHLVEKVMPALQTDKIVLCDRFVDSSLVYQGMGRNLGIETVYQMNLFAIEDVMPDLTIFFDVEPTVGLARIAADNTREVNRLDMETIEFHQKVYEGYLEVARHFPNRIQSIDASQNQDTVFEQCLSLIKSRL